MQKKTVHQLAIVRDENICPVCGERITEHKLCSVMITAPDQKSSQEYSCNTLFCHNCNLPFADKSTGRTVEEMTVFTEVADLGIVLDRIRSLDYVDADNVFALGSSQGGLVTALLAEERPEDIKGMILFYPAFNIPEIVEKFSSLAGNGGFFGGFGGFGLSDAFVDSVKDYDVYAHIGKYPGDIIILHGTKDFLVDIKYSEKAVETYPSAVLYPIQGANHGFNNENLSGMASMTGGEKDSVVMPYVFDYLAGHIR